MEKIEVKSVQEAAVDARKKCVIDAYETLKATEDWQKRGKMMRLYMLCLALDLTVPVVSPMLSELGIEL